MRIQLHGGLGNQLFIWAMARWMETDTNQQVKLVYVRDKHTRDDRPIELNELLAGHDGKVSIQISKSLGFLLKTVDKLSSTKGLNWINPSRLFGIDTMEHTYDFPRTLSGTKLLRGFFQNREMVDFQRESLFPELARYLGKVNLPVNSKAHSRELVLHIRRGDSVGIANQWGLLNFDYYKRIMRDSVGVTILTDDETYLLDIQVHFPEAEILTPKDCSSWQALKIMANAKNLVMANSSLSWWGGWLILQNGGTCTFPYPWRPGDINVTEKLVLPGATLADACFLEE